MHDLQVTRGSTNSKALRLALQAGRAEMTGRLWLRQLLQLQGQQGHPAAGQGHPAAGRGRKSRRESRQPGHMRRSSPTQDIPRERLRSRIMSHQLRQQLRISRGSSAAAAAGRPR